VWVAMGRVWGAMGRTGRRGQCMGRHGEAGRHGQGVGRHGHGPAFGPGRQTGRPSTDWPRSRSGPDPPAGIGDRGWADTPGLYPPSCTTRPQRMVSRHHERAARVRVPMRPGPPPASRGGVCALPFGNDISCQPERVAAMAAGCSKRVRRPPMEEILSSGACLRELAGREWPAGRSRSCTALVDAPEEGMSHRVACR
jgi:hypothetical protein